MTSTLAAENAMAPALVRLASLHPLDLEACMALALAVQRPRRTRARRELVSEGQPIPATLLVLGGWAARVRVSEDGRRQIVNFVLPGDLIGLCDQHRPVASSSVIALTDVDACIAPDAGVSPTLAFAYAHSRALEDAYLVGQIARLGRLNAQERVADLFLELLERLERVGLATDGRYLMPLTQEVIADVVGLTSVHVNRTLQALRREGMIDWSGRELVLPEPDLLRRNVGRRPVKVTAD